MPYSKLNAKYAPHLWDLKHRETKDIFLLCFLVTGARFLKVPVTFRARNQIFKSKSKERVLSNKPVHFVLLTDNYIM